MTPDESFAFLRMSYPSCIRCNACCNVCPACSCDKCVFDNTHRRGTRRHRYLRRKYVSHHPGVPRVPAAARIAANARGMPRSRIRFTSEPQSSSYDIDEFYGEFQAVTISRGAATNF